MSLFENDAYRWRETYFVVFRKKNRPTADAILELLKTHGSRYQVDEVRRDDEGLFESLTLLSPDDFAAMDISYVVGEEVNEQVDALTEELANAPLSDLERRKYDRLQTFDARFDISHFRHVVMLDERDDESFLDPGALLIVLQRLARLCHGVGVDPQSGTLV